MGNGTSKDHGPEPDIQILLDPECRPPFTSGSIISGTAISAGQIPLYIRRAHIALVGRAVSHCVHVSESTSASGTKSRSISHYHCNVPLFERRAVLCENSWLGGQYLTSFRFSFTFPSAPDVQHGYSPFRSEKVWDVKMGVGSRWIKDTHVDPALVYETTAQSLSLPSSFVRSNGAQIEAKYAKVEYGTQVSATFQDQSEFTSELTLLEFVSQPPKYHLEYKSILGEPELYHSSRLAGAHKSFRNSFKDKLSTHTPSLRLTIGVELPSHIITVASNHSTFNVHALVKIDSVSTKDIDIRSVQIRVKKLTLGAVTSFRGLGSDSRGNPSSSSRPGEHDTYEQDQIDLHYSTTAVEVHRQGQSTSSFDDKPNSTQFSDDWVFPASFEILLAQQDVGSTFRTCNISRRYYLDTMIEAEVCEKTFSHTVRSPVVAVPGDQSPGYEESW